MMAGCKKWDATTLATKNNNNLIFFNFCFVLFLLFLSHTTLFLFICRALEVFKDYGRRLSEIIEDQRKMPGMNIAHFSKTIINHAIKWRMYCAKDVTNVMFYFLLFQCLSPRQSLRFDVAPETSLTGASNLGGPKRFEHVIIFWLQCEQVSYLTM